MVLGDGKHRVSKYLRICSLQVSKKLLGTLEGSFVCLPPVG